VTRVASALGSVTHVPEPTVFHVPGLYKPGGSDSRSRRLLWPTVATNQPLKITSRLPVLSPNFSVGTSNAFIIETKRSDNREVFSSNLRN
jgi:hypothetical protein